MIIKRGDYVIIKDHFHDGLYEVHKTNSDGSWCLLFDGYWYNSRRLTYLCHKTGFTPFIKALYDIPET